MIVVVSGEVCIQNHIRGYLSHLVHHECNFRLVLQELEMLVPGLSLQSRERNGVQEFLSVSESGIDDF